MKHENEEILHSFSLGDLGKKGILLAFEYFEVPHKGLYLKYCKHWLHSLAYTYKLCNFSLKEYHTSKPKILYINCTNFHYCPDSPIDPPKKSKVYDSFECLQYTMRRNLPKTFSVLKFQINLLNFSLKNIWQTVQK